MLEGEEMSFNERAWLEREWLVSEPVSLCGALAAPRAFYWNTGWVELPGSASSMNDEVKGTLKCAEPVEQPG